MIFTEAGIAGADSITFMLYDRDIDFQRLVNRVAGGKPQQEPRDSRIAVRDAHQDDETGSIRWWDERGAGDCRHSSGRATRQPSALFWSIRRCS